MKRILALATCHNRRAKTLRALRSLLRQEIPADYKLDVCLVDDGSTDGTTEAVRHALPEVVILQGSGCLFWAGGMRFAWEAYARHERFEYLLVFNDDIALYDGALSRLLVTANELEGIGDRAFAVSGALRESSSESIAYGGVVRSSRWHPLRFRKLPPTEHMQECHTLNMNFALISSGAIARIGFLSSEFAHGKADYDFGLRLRASGGRVVLAPNYLGECDTNPRTRTSAAANLSLAERWRRLTGIKEQSPRERAVYYRRHAGILWPVWWAAPYVRVLAQFLIRDLVMRARGQHQRRDASSKRPNTL